VEVIKNMRDNSRTLTWAFWVFIFVALISAAAVVIAALISSAGRQPPPTASLPSSLTSLPSSQPINQTPVTQVIPITQIVQVTQVLPVISQMEVYANKEWQDTGIEVSTRDIITIQYVSGRWHLWPGQDTYDGTGFGGDPTCDCNVLMYVSHGGLIGRIGNSTPFYVGNAYEALALQIGKLYLRTNDVVLSDNSGSITVNIEVKQ